MKLSIVCRGTTRTMWRPSKCKERFRVVYPESLFLRTSCRKLGLLKLFALRLPGILSAVGTLLPMDRSFDSFLSREECGSQKLPGANTTATADPIPSLLCRTRRILISGWLKHDVDWRGMSICQCRPDFCCKSPLERVIKILLTLSENSETF